MKTVDCKWMAEFLMSSMKLVKMTFKVSSNFLLLHENLRGWFGASSCLHIGNQICSGNVHLGNLKNSHKSNIDQSPGPVSIFSGKHSYITSNLGIFSTTGLKHSGQMQKKPQNKNITWLFGLLISFVAQ